jgi:hypothetical protein
MPGAGPGQQGGCQDGFAEAGHRPRQMGGDHSARLIRRVVALLTLLTADLGCPALDATRHLAKQGDRVQLHLKVGLLDHRDVMTLLTRQTDPHMDARVPPIRQTYSHMLGGALPPSMQAGSMTRSGLSVWLAPRYLPEE